MLKKKSVTDFCSDLASDQPTPGGGSGAAAGGALGASLLGMVAERTLERHKTSAEAEELRDLRDGAVNLRKTLLDLIDKDTTSYNEVMTALHLPKGTEAEKEIRRNALQKAFLFASEVPMTTAESCLAVLTAARTLVPRIDPQLSSDLATGVLLAHAGALGAVLNIEANAPYLRDAGVASRLRERSARLREQAGALCDHVRKTLDSLKSSS
jgi:formiminotetrahydrofolate cyclodeaminase